MARAQLARTTSVLVAGIALSLAAPAQSSSYAHITVASHRVDEGRRAIRVAEEYVEDKLKDPFSAKYRHVAVSTSGPGLQNVCGYVYAKNGYGVYDGGARFVVGLSDGNAVAELSDIDNNREAASLFSTFDFSTCTKKPFYELAADVQRMVYEEVAADTAAHEEEDSCLNDFKNGTQAHPSQHDAAQSGELSCFTDAQARQRTEYSRILRTDYSGAMGLH